MSLSKTAKSPYVCFTWPGDIFHAREEKMSTLAHRLKIWQRSVCVLHSPLISLSTHSYLYLSWHNRHDLADVTALWFGASGHWWSICLPLYVCMWERIARLFVLCQMRCHLVGVVRERETDPRERFCARAKPVACRVPGWPAHHGLVLTVFSQHQAGMIKVWPVGMTIPVYIKEWCCAREICGAGCPLKGRLSALWKILFIESSSELLCR